MKSLKELKLDVDTYLNLLSDSYNETNTNLQRARGLFLSNKNNIKDNVDRSALGRQQNELLKIMNEHIKTKLDISRLIKDGIATFSSNGSEGEDENTLEMDTIQKLEDFLKKNKKE